MPGWINVPIKIETYERLNKARGELSFDKFTAELLDIKDGSLNISPENLKRLEDYRSNPRETVDDLIKAVLDELEKNITLVSKEK